MAEPTPSQERPAGDAGLIEHLRFLAASLVGYLQARLELAGIESKEALAHYLQILALIVAGAVIAIFGYIFFCIGLVLLIAHFAHVHWMWIILGLGVAHFVLALVCVLLARGRLFVPMFSATISELRKDQEWLRTPARPN